MCKCGKPSPVGRRYCLTCHASYMRAWRKNRPLTPEQRLRDNARSYAGVYLRRGLIQRQPCEQCSALKAQMLHEDYSKPLAIRWVCRACRIKHFLGDKHPAGKLPSESANWSPCATR